MLSGITPTNPLNADQLLDRFATGTNRQRRTLVKTIESRLDDLIDLGTDLLKPFDANGDDWAAGWILQLVQRHHPALLDGLMTDRDRGWPVTE